ncbi:MAG TPA: hypothetical protein VE646_02735 [Actinomycetota bacterium]|nr:hypothetical protein [Actinomycetota bacterium]
MLKFRTMAPVTGPFVGGDNPVRGLAGGGFAWKLDRAHGKLRSDGHLTVAVRGLVLVDDDPVPEPLRGTNPIPAFQAVVSCLTIDHGTAATTNVATDPFPASTSGDSTIEATLDLPSPCIAPVVFVGPSPTVWFAATGA